MAHPYRIREIAVQAGLSERTVDRVLNNRGQVRESTVREVHQAIADLDRQRSQISILPVGTSSTLQCTPSVRIGLATRTARATGRGTPHRRSDCSGRSPPTADRIADGNARVNAVSSWLRLEYQLRRSIAAVYSRLRPEFPWDRLACVHGMWSGDYGRHVPH